MACSSCQLTPEEKSRRKTNHLVCHTCIYGREGKFEQCSVGGVFQYACPIGKHADPSGKVKWLGITWRGLPWPKRFLLRQPLKGWWFAPAIKTPTPDGCGCIDRLKTLWERWRK